MYSRFATLEEIQTDEFRAINAKLDAIHRQHDLPDHTDVNAERYPWSSGMLSHPAFYAARLWEYPFCITAAELCAGMSVADIGCGMSALTVYLKDVSDCDVIGVDPDVFEEGIRYLGHGVSAEFLNKTGLKFKRGDLESIPLPDASLDRVFCVSVMEHVPPHVARRGMQEIARVLKPGGRAILTVDVAMHFVLNRPLELVAASGIQLAQPYDLRWPIRRFGRFSDSGKPADVVGLVLTKDERLVETSFPATGETLPAYRIPSLTPEPEPLTSRLWRRAGRRAVREISGILGRNKSVRE